MRHLMDMHLAILYIQWRCQCVCEWVRANIDNFIGTSLSEPHVDRKASPATYVSIYLAYVIP